MIYWSSQFLINYLFCCRVQNSFGCKVDTSQFPFWARPPHCKCIDSTRNLSGTGSSAPYSYGARNIYRFPKNSSTHHILNFILPEKWLTMMYMVGILLALTMYYRSMCTSLSASLRDMESDQDICGAQLRELKAIVDKRNDHESQERKRGEALQKQIATLKDHIARESYRSALERCVFYLISKDWYPIHLLPNALYLCKCLRIPNIFMQCYKWPLCSYHQNNLYSFLTTSWFCHKLNWLWSVLTS